MLCEYKDMLGVPGEGLHRFRVADVAVVDVFFTIVLAALIALYTGSYFTVLFGLFLLGIILHRVFCVQTTVDKLLFN